MRTVALACAISAPLAAAYSISAVSAAPQRRRACAATMGSTADFKVGLTIEFEDQVWKIQEFLHVKPGKGSAFVRSKMKNLINGAVLEKTWKAGESFPDAQVDKEEMQYSYLDDGDMVFMNLETFEEVSADGLDPKPGPTARPAICTAA